MSTTEIPSGEGALRGPGPRDSGHPGRPAARGTGGSTPWSTGWQPLAGAALLERLRVTGRPRPAADPALASDLRSYIDSGLHEMFGQDAGPALVVTKDRLTRALACPAHRWGERTGERSGAAEFTMPLATGALVDVLFRQLVTIGSIDSPMADAMDGLCADSHRARLVGWIEGLASAEQRELRSEVERQADGLRQRWPALDPSWLPRTQTPLRAVLAEGHVDLSVYVDLAIGRPAADVASVALVDVRSGGRHPGHRDDRHLCALVEALRSPAPPFAVATYYTKTGELDVDPVDSELLAAAARRCLVGIRAMDSLNRGEEPGRTDSGISDSGSSDSGSSDSGSCTKCALQLSGEPAAQTVPIGVMPSVVEARSESPSALIGYAQGQAA